jgi:hypothetical protein
MTSSFPEAPTDAIAIPRSLREPPGQHLYTRSENAYMATVAPDGGDAASALVPNVREIWLARDGVVGR